MSLDLPSKRTIFIAALAIICGQNVVFVNFYLSVAREEHVELIVEYDLDATPIERHPDPPPSRITAVLNAELPVRLREKSEAGKVALATLGNGSAALSDHAVRYNPRDHPVEGSVVGPPECAKSYTISDELWSHFQLCSAVGDADSSMSCTFNDFRHAALCSVQRLRVFPSRAQMSMGGEDVNTVMGRGEPEEFPVYTPDAFEYSGCRLNREFFGNLDFYTRQVLDSTAHGLPITRETCTVWEERPTLMIMRYEYVNLYHTMTDWFNTFQAIQMLHLHPNQSVVIVFLDGHAAGNLDQAWSDMFGAQVVRLKHIGTTCFRHVSFIPAGYLSPLNFEIETTARCRFSPAVRQFGEMVVARYAKEVTTASLPRVTVILRRPYLAHPRVRPSIARKTENEDQLRAALDAVPQIRVTYADFASMTFGQQVQLVRNTDILVGIHGAGLSHTLFLKPGSGLIEIANGGRNHFQNFCAWVGEMACRGPQAGGGEESVMVNPQEVVNEIRSVIGEIKGRHPEWILPADDAPPRTPEVIEQPQTPPVVEIPPTEIRVPDWPPQNRPEPPIREDRPPVVTPETPPRDEDPKGAEGLLQDARETAREERKARRKAMRDRIRNVVNQERGKGS